MSGGSTGTPESPARVPGTGPWNAKAAGKELLDGIAAAIKAERAIAKLDGREITDRDIARAILASPALREANRGIMDGLEAEYKPRLAAAVAAEAGHLIEAAAPAIRASVAGEIAAAIEGSVCEPGDQCTAMFCPDCTRYAQSRADAALARKIGGAQ